MFEVIPTGSIGLDRALGVGGLPRGRIVEIYGQEDSGKTALAISLIAQAQRAGDLVAVIDADHRFDVAFAQQCGVDTDWLLLSQPDSGEEAHEIIEHLVRESKVRLIVVDSVAALVPKAELEAEADGLHVGLQARIMSQALRKLTPVVHKQNCTIVFLNRVVTRIGVSLSPEMTIGGRALRFYSSVRIELKRISGAPGGSRAIRVRATVVKNKVAPPHGTTEFGINESGIERLKELVDHSLAVGILQKAGAWICCGDDMVLGKNRTDAVGYLKINPKLVALLESQLWAKLPKQEGYDEAHVPLDGSST